MMIIIIIITIIIIRREAGDAAAQRDHPEGPQRGSHRSHLRGSGHQPDQRDDGGAAALADDLWRLINSANAPIFGIDTTGMVTEWNRKAASLLGFTKEETMGKNLVQTFIQPEDRKSVDEVHISCVHHIYVYIYIYMHMCDIHTYTYIYIYTYLSTRCCGRPCRARKRRTTSCPWCRSTASSPP